MISKRGGLKRGGITSVHYIFHSIEKSLPCIKISDFYFYIGRHSSFISKGLVG